MIHAPTSWVFVLTTQACQCLIRPRGITAMARRTRSHGSPDSPARSGPTPHLAEAQSEAFHRTRLGQMVLGDALDVLPQLSPQSVDLIMKSPPFGLVRKKGYGNADA